MIETTDETSKSLQETYAPQNTCFGCGPLNTDGLQIKSFFKDGETSAIWTPQSRFEAFSGFLNGGIISSLLDCHCNWSAIAHAMLVEQRPEIPCTVTANLNVEFLAPTSARQSVHLKGRVIEVKGSKFKTTGEILVDDRITAKCQATFVAVQPGHPAYHRW